MKFVKLTLGTGKEVNVYPVPPYLLDMILTRFEEPKPPMRPVNPEVAIPGTDEKIEDKSDPAYKLALEDYNNKRNDAWSDARLVYGLRDENPPASWPDANTREVWDFFEIEPIIPTDNVGRRLAYIKYELLQSTADLTLVWTTVDAFAVTSPEEVEKLKNSFRDTNSGDTATKVPLQEGQG